MLTSMVDGCAEHTTVDVAAAGCSSDARCSAAGYVPRFAEEHLTHGETRADCVPISITLAVTQAIQVAIKHLCSHESAGSVAAWHERGAPGSTCHADAPRKSHTDATALPAAGGLQGDAAAGHGSTIHGAFPAAVCPTVHTPAMLGEAGGSGPAPGSTDHKSMVVGGEWPSGTPPVDNTPNMQHELASAECIFRSFPSVRPALIDCIERAFDAANKRWAEEEPGVFAGTPMYRGGHTPLQNHGAAVPHEVESVLALCGTLGEECDALLPQDVLAARTSQWLTSMRVDPPLGWQLPRDDAGASPLLYSPLSPFGGYGASTSSGVVVTMMHAVPMAALVASLDAAMKLPMHALSGVKAAQHIRSMMRLRAQLQAACCSTLRGAHKAINASDEGPSSTQVVQAVAAASTAMSCAMVAIDASGKCSASLANQQASLGGMQAVPQALHTLYDVAWRSPLPNTQSSVQRVMMQLIQNTSHCEMHNSLASAALDLAAGSPQTPTVPHSDVDASPQWLCVAMFAISSLTACAVASVPDSTSIPPETPAQLGATGTPRASLGAAQQPLHDKIARDQVPVVLAATLKLILRALALPAVAAKGSSAVERVAAPAAPCGVVQGSVTGQQWRAWLTVLLQLCLESAAAELEASVATVDGRNDGDFTSLQTVLVEAGNYLTSAKVRLSCSLNLVSAGGHAC